MSGEDLAAAARALVGIPFRLHGRDPRSGLDCIGVLAAAFAAIGRPARLPNGYALRRRDVPDFGALAAGLGLVPASGTIYAGDVLMLRTGPCQLHAAVAASFDTVVHAHAGLRKVVLGPLPGGWPVLGHWRLPSLPSA